MNLVETWRGADGLEPGDWLTDAERATYAGLKTPKRKRDWLLGRRAAKALYQRFDGAAGADVEIRNDADGVPYAVRGGVRSWSLSLSHSGELGVAAANTGKRPVGVDSEVIEPRASAWRDLAFDPSEYAGVDAGEMDSHLTKRWTEKEAVLKLLGLGLSTDLKNVKLGGTTVELKNGAAEKWRTLGAPAIRLDSRRDGNYWITLASVEEASQWNL